MSLDVFADAADPFGAALATEGVTDPVLQRVARSIYGQESGFGANPRTSAAGAVGGMQVIPATFRRVADPGWDVHNPQHNLRAGVRYLKQLWAQTGGDPRLTAAGYHSGEGAVAGGQLRPRYDKAAKLWNWQYADQVLRRARLTQPQGVLDVFAAKRAPLDVFAASQDNSGSTPLTGR